LFDPQLQASTKNAWIGCWWTSNVC